MIGTNNWQLPPKTPLAGPSYEVGVEAMRHDQVRTSLLDLQAHWTNPRAIKPALDCNAGMLEAAQLGLVHRPTQRQDADAMIGDWSHRG
jgi:hypothetical protein